MIERFDVYVSMALAGFFSGCGGAVSNWLINRKVLLHIEILEKKIKKLGLRK